MSDDDIQYCPDDALGPAAALGAEDSLKGAEAVETLARTYPADPRLPFLRGSFLAAAGDYGQAVAAMARAVEIAPGYAIARFQLGFLLLTSGDPVRATEAWGPLMLQPADQPLRLFAEGLQHMIRDEFDAARDRLEAGIARNSENEPLNNDMRLLIRKMSEQAPGGAGEEETSSVHWLLREAEQKTRH